jgi:hypothetical protein
VTPRATFCRATTSTSLHGQPDQTSPGPKSADSNGGSNECRWPTRRLTGSCFSVSAVRRSPALRHPLLGRTGGWRPAEGVANCRPGGEHGECPAINVIALVKWGPEMTRSAGDGTNALADRDKPMLTGVRDPLSSARIAVPQTRLGTVSRSSPGTLVSTQRPVPAAVSAPAEQGVRCPVIVVAPGLQTVVRTQKQMRRSSGLVSP